MSTEQHVPSGATADYWVTPADLEHAAGRTRAGAQDVSIQLDDLRSYVMRLEEHWTGSAHLQFMQLMGDWDTYAKMLNEALLDIASGMEGNKLNYEESEKANLRNLHHVHLPNANF
jgi:WXG100 family type VII secretion target